MTPAALAEDKPTRESSKATKYKDAETLLIARKKTIREGKEPEPIKRIPNYTFLQLASEYIKWCERQRSFRSKKGSGIDVSKICKGFGGGGHENAAGVVGANLVQYLVKGEVND